MNETERSDQARLNPSAFEPLLAMRRELEAAAPRILASVAPPAQALRESADRMARDVEVHFRNVS